jgi:hypothetical protein
MEILDGIEIMDLAIFLKKSKALIISDIHAGYEEALNRQGVLVPRFQFTEVAKRVQSILAKVNPKMIVVNGDIKHEFGEISEQEWRETLKILDMLSASARVVLIKGNHDTILGPIARKREIEIKEQIVIDDILVVHGHKLVEMPRGIKTIVIGHEHPAVSLTEGARSETYKCFLVGKYKGKNLVVQPSFNLIVEGTDVLREELLSPFLHGSLRKFRVFVVSGNASVLDFGTVADLSRV